MRILYLAMLSAIILSFGGCFYDDEKLVYKKGRYSSKECHKNDNIDYDIDRVVVDKSKHKLYLYRGSKIEHKFSISLSRQKGRKLKAGDNRVPEGHYHITRRRCHRKYYKMIGLSYPNSVDKRRASTRGVYTGSGITIHGQLFWNANGKGDRYTLSKDWTRGCISLRNRDMDIFWNSVPKGTPIEIKP
jgi:murein L,D-transpeptidase YafK